MNKIDKRRRISIKWNIFFCLMIFAGVIVLLMWLSQSVFLEKIYKTIKIKEIERAAHTLVDHIDAEDEAKTVDNIASADNVCVIVLSIDGNMKATPLYTNHTVDTCVIHSIDTQSFFSLYTSAKENGGEQLQRFMYDASTRRYIGLTGDFFDKSSSEREGSFPESIIYSVVTENSAGDEIFILLNSSISPVGATIKTLNRLLVLVTVALVVMALALAFIISRLVSRPIVRLTKAAGELAEGNYEARFEEGGYREVAELSGALNYAESELAKTDTLRRELIANISHDLRTPLTLITGYSEAMKDIPGESTPENVQVIIDESKRLSSLVNDVLDVSRLESGVGANNPEPFNITEAVNETLRRFSKLCERDGYIMEFFCEGDAWVFADEHRITQAVYNLVCNALTHTGEDRKVTVSQNFIPADGAAARVRISVSDTGEGIPADKLPLIWERYYKVDRVHKRAAVGSGLGLSIVRTVMELNGGTWGVSSAEGKGSTFWIELAVCEPPAANKETGEERDEQSGE